jgi:hypothetical protein
MTWATAGRADRCRIRITVNITVNAVNDAPVNSVPAAQSPTKTRRWSSPRATATQSRLGPRRERGDGLVQITLTATNGTLTLGSLTA